MANPPLKIATLFLLLLSATLLWGCSAPTAAPETTVIVTVLETMPVEVTRLVEVTKEVIVTEIVEVPLSDAEKENLEKSAASVRKGIDAVR